MLLELHSTLLSASALNSTQQTVLRVAVVTLMKQSHSSSAVQLLWLAGSTAQMTMALQEQIGFLLEQGLLQHLAERLLDVQECGPAVCVLLQTMTRLASMATQQQLNAWLNSKHHQIQILTAACTSTAAADAAAVLMLLAASRGLYAAEVLQPLIEIYNRAAAVVDICHWSTIALPPLLHHIHKHLITWQAQVSELEPQQPLSEPQQQVTLLLCSIVAVVHRSAARGMSPTTLYSFFKSPVVKSALQKALTLYNFPKVQHAVLHMVNQLAALSVELACCSFQAVAPLVYELLQAEEISAGNRIDNGVYIQAATAKVWKEVLKRVTHKPALEAAVAKQMPHAAAAVALMARQVAAAAASDAHACEARVRHSSSRAADAAVAVSSSSSCWRYSFSSVMPQVAAFMPLATSYSSYNRPLLPEQPRHTVAALAPHLDSMIQLIAAAPAEFAARASPQQDSAHSLAFQQQVEMVTLLAVWMLHSLVDALSQLEKAGRATVAQCSCTGAALTDAVHAAAALIALGDAAGGSSARLNIQTAAIQVVRSIVGATWCSSLGQPSPAAWHGMIAALAALLATADQSLGTNVAKRRLVCVASQLAGELAVHMPHLLLVPMTISTGICCSSTPARTAARPGPVTTCTAPCSAAETAQLGPVCSAAELLLGHLKTVMVELGRRKLERSSSGQELLEAADDAVQLISKVWAALV